VPDTGSTGRWMGYEEGEEKGWKGGGKAKLMRWIAFGWE
jgi:hypothetical protein